MKKGFKLFFTAVIGIILLLNLDVLDSYASNATVSFGSSSYSKTYGEEFPIGLYVKSDMSVGIHAIRLRYDTSKLQYISGATKESNGVILLKGTGGQNSVKYWLLFKAIGGGDTNLTVDVAKVYINNNTQLLNLSALPSAPIHIEGGEAASTLFDISKYTKEQKKLEGQGIKEESQQEILNEDIDIEDNVTNNTKDAMSSDVDAVDTNDEVSVDVDSESYEETNSEEEIVESEDLGTEESANDINDNEEGEGDFLLSVLLNLLIFVGFTALGIVIINTIINKGKRKARLEHEFEEEFTKPYIPPQDNSYRNSDYMNRAHRNNQPMSSIPYNNYSDRDYNRNDSAIRYDQNYYDNPNQIDVEFVCNSSPIEDYAQQQQGDRAHFDYIEQNLEKSLEEQIKQQMDNYY